MFRTEKIWLTWCGLEDLINNQFTFCDLGMDWCSVFIERKVPIGGQQGGGSVERRELMEDYIKGNPWRKKETPIEKRKIIVKTTINEKDETIEKDIKLDENKTVKVNDFRRYNKIIVKIELKK